MMTEAELRDRLKKAEAYIQELQNELDETNRGLVALTVELDQQTEALQLSEQLYRGIFEYSGVGIMTFDENDIVQSWNRAAVDILGYSADEMIGHSFHCIVPDDLQKSGELVSLKSQVDEMGSVIRYETRRIRKDGAMIQIALTRSALKDDEDNNIGYIAMLTDITEVKKAEKAIRESEARFRRITEGSFDIIFELDKEGVITYLSPAIENITGYLPEDLIGAFYTSIFPSSEIPKVNHAVQTVLEGNTLVDYETRIINKKGDLLICEVNSSPILTDEGITGLQGVLQDITARKTAEVVLQNHAHDLQMMNVELEAANKELEAFSYSVSHDLRAPLRAIDGFSQALIEDYADSLDDEAKSYLERVRAGAQRMGQLINDLLILSRITRREMNVEAINMAHIAVSVIEDLKKNESGRKVEFVYEPSILVNGDPSLIRIVMENLLGNAWKFTSKTEASKIELSGYKDGNKTVCCVSDNGAGFNMEHAGRLFSPFQRLHTVEEFPGTGIGLATVQRIINRHGGRVWAEGEEGKGARFYFSLDSACGQEGE